jgi:hypothetical protein
MKWLKICALVAFTLAVMRASSWLVAWILTRLRTVKLRTIAVVSNVAAFSGFLLFLYFSLVPGEPIDLAAVLFGLLFFFTYTLTDFFWIPWKRRH